VFGLLVAVAVVGVGVVFVSVVVAAASILTSYSRGNPQVGSELKSHTAGARGLLQRALDLEPNH